MLEALHIFGDATSTSKKAGRPKGGFRVAKVLKHLIAVRSFGHSLFPAKILTTLSKACLIEFFCGEIQ